MAIGQQQGSIGMGGRNPSNLGIMGIGVGLNTPDPLAYNPNKDKYLSNFRVNSMGNLVGEYKGKPMEMNGVGIDLKALNPFQGTTPTVSKLRADNSGKVFGTVNYEIANPNFGKWVTRQSPYGGFFGGGMAVKDDSKSVGTSKEVELTGFQLDMDNLARSRAGNLPDKNNLYFRYDDSGLLGDIQAIWEGNTTFTAATGRQLTQQERTPEGVRLSRKSGKQTSTLGGAPTSTAAGSQLADEINLRNRKGTLIT
jgi:hypothetical protein